MDKAAVFRRTAGAFNKAMLPVLHTGPGQKLLGRSFATLTYTGRKSGREFVLPVNYRRDRATGDIVVIVATPNVKTWWRNFSGDGAPVRVRTGAEERTGHGRVERTAKRTKVRVTLDA